MKIETLRDPIPTYDKSIREKLQSRKVRLSRAVTREKESNGNKREYPAQEEEKNAQEQLLPADAVPEAHQEATSHSLDVVV